MIINEFNLCYAAPRQTQDSFCIVPLLFKALQTAVK